MQLPMSIDSDIFLCHSSEDKEFVRRLAHDLHEFRVSAWFDEWELEPGDSLFDRIGDALESSVYVGVVLSPASIESRWCKKELNQALAREIRLGAKTILPMRIENVSMPAFLEEKFYLDFSASYYLPFTKLCAMVHQYEARYMNKAMQEHPPGSLGDVRFRLSSCGFDEEKLSTEDGAYRRLKKLNAMAPRAESLVSFGIVCYGMQKDREAADAFARVLAEDKTFSSFSELNNRVQRLAKDGASFELDKNTRIAMVYLGVIHDDDDYVLNAAYDTAEREVLLGAGIFYLDRYDADIDAAVGYFIKATEGVSADSEWVRRCDYWLFRILKDKKVMYPKDSWNYIEKRVRDWNRHKWSLI